MNIYAKRAHSNRLVVKLRIPYFCRAADGEVRRKRVVKLHPFSARTGSDSSGCASGGGRGGDGARSFARRSFTRPGRRSRHRQRRDCAGTCEPARSIQTCTGRLETERRNGQDLELLKSRAVVPVVAAVTAAVVLSPAPSRRGRRHRP